MTETTEQTKKTSLLVRFPFIPIPEHIQKFERLFYDLYYLLLQETPQNIVAIEIVNIRETINFYITTYETLIEPITNMIFSIFPDTEVEKAERFRNIETLPNHALGYNLTLLQQESFSIRTYRQTGGQDSLVPFLNLASTIPSKHAVLFQIVLSPRNEELESEGRAGLFYVSKESGEAVEKPKFDATMRLLYFFPDGEEVEANNKIKEVVRSFHEFSSEKNKIVFNKAENAQKLLANFFGRKNEQRVILNTEEVTTLYHIPDPALKIEAIDWVLSKRAQPPFNLPTANNTPDEDISLYAHTNFRASNRLFGIKRVDRRRHLYVVGKSGTGKSKLLLSLITDDIHDKKGVCVIDPHGDLISDILAYAPRERLQDIIVFNASDLQHPTPFNVLEGVPREMKQQVTQGLIEVFKKFFGGDWSPKIEHVFRFTTLAMLDYPESSIVGMQKMLTNRKFRQKVIPVIKDSVVKHFWANEFSSWSEKFDNEAILPLVNKLGQFLSNELVRNIVIQPKNTIDFDGLMNNEKILLIALSRGLLGEENANLLGAMIITKIYQTAMSRAKLAESQRHDFYFYIDEFQNFATETFENILSEARKYRLCLTISHQFLSQVPADIKGAVFGNVGSLISFRVGADDGEYISKEYYPVFTVHDFINLGVREILVKMSIDGHTSPPFSAFTKRVPDPPEDSAQIVKMIMDNIHTKYTRPLADVEAYVEKINAADEISGEGSGEAAAGGAGSSFEQPMV
ncbi:type IV secretory system conjugative DNA transfer family protein [Candidatus Falkowbacteria bacterium]|nr:type IV secretory system conjugative DNA transfer family protein [Candidatus Falkowbacteria bacterium]